MTVHPNRIGSGRRIDAAAVQFLFVGILLAVFVSAKSFASTAMTEIDAAGTSVNRTSPPLTVPQTPGASLTYYVSPMGNDRNAGTSISAPLKTIGRAAALVNPGDLVLIRGGTYRELIEMNQSGMAQAPIIFAPYRNERVTISGVVPVTDWSGPNSKGVFQAQVAGPIDLKPENYQVFVDGRMAPQSREPDSEDPMNPFSLGQWPAMNKLKDESGGHFITMDSGALGDDYKWDGSFVWGKFPNKDGNVWSLSMARIVTSEPGRLTLGEVDNAWDEKDWTGDTGAGVIIGGLSALDSANEWHFDKSGTSAGGTLYYRPPVGQNPNNMSMRIRQRMWVVKGNASHLVFRNLDFFGGQIWLEGDHNVFDNVSLTYGSHYSYRDKVAVDIQYRNGVNGMFLLGDDNLIKNSVIAYSAGSGLSIIGDRNTVFNSLIHDFGYMGTFVSGVYFKGTGSTLTHSTLFNSGRDVLHLGGCAACKITYNHLYDAALLADDNGVIYTFGHNLEYTEIAYNWIRVATSDRDTRIGLGVYLDNGSRYATVHHNVITGLGVEPGIQGNTPHEGHLIYNNTIVHNRINMPPDDDPKEYYKDIGENAYCNCNFDWRATGPERFYFERVGECQHEPQSNDEYESACTNDDYEYWINPEHPDASNTENPRRLKVFNTQYYTDLEQMSDGMNGDDLINPVINVSEANGWEILGNPDFRPANGATVLIDKGSTPPGVIAEQMGDGLDLGAYEHNGTNWIPGYRHVPRSPDVTTCPNATRLVKDVVAFGVVHIYPENNVKWDSYRFTMPQDGYILMHANVNVVRGTQAGFTLNRLYDPLPIVETQIAGEGVMFANLYAGDYCLTVHPDWRLTWPEWMFAAYTFDISSPLLVSASASAFKPGGTVAGVHFYSEDVLAWRRLYNGQERWTMLFDGSDVGIEGNVTNIAAEGGSSDRLLLSVAKRQDLPGVGQVGPTDIIVFDPDPGGLGENTAGQFIAGLEGNKHELQTAGERIDAIDGWIYGYEADPTYRGCFGYPISTSGVATVTTWGDRTMKQDNEDVFCKVYDDAAGGWRYWDYFFDVAGKRNAPPTEPAAGNVPGLAEENVTAIAYNDQADKMYMTVANRATIWNQNLTCYDIFAIDYPAYTWSGILWRGPDHGWNFCIDAIEWNGP